MRVYWDLSSDSCLFHFLETDCSVRAPRCVAVTMAVRYIGFWSGDARRERHVAEASQLV